ncbi:hypothetical protein NQ314_003027 [Rhamnusium bicolor]|uniref:Uncharacterized protein n=1 Tax=Rhamnusium bicolor TaxID=1586634 RepID=A0AAV8ZQD5_9CUCU|nr:hypothetical protein NQ314_003027 [Rhamnusium bicolor]
MAHEVVKMKQGMSYSCKEKTIILNVFKYFRTMHPEKCVTEIVRRTAKATGCSEKSVFQFRKEEASVEGFKEPSKTKVRKNININSRFIKYDDTVRQGIRHIIYDLKYRNIVPSLSTLLKNINANEKLPNFSVMTLRRLLRDMGFYYEKEKSCNANNLTHQTVQHSAMHNQRQKINNVKPFSLPPQNNININMQQNQLYVPNNSHRPLPMPLTHHENDGIDPIYIPSGIMPHQIHGVPPPSGIRTNMSFIHPPHPNSMILQ